MEFTVGGGSDSDGRSAAQAHHRRGGRHLPVRLDAAHVMGAVSLMAGFGAPDDLDAIVVTAPTALHVLDSSFDDLGRFDLWLTGEIHVPELPSPSRAQNIEASEVAAVATSPSVLGVGKIRHVADPSRSGPHLR